MVPTITQNSKPTPPNSPDLFDTSYLTADLKGRSIRGGAFTVFSQAFKFLFQTGSTVVLARILTPADFGLIAMVSVVTNFAGMFRDLGLSTATIQKAQINHDQISTMFWINAALGAWVACSVVALAPAVAWFYDDLRLTSVTMALGSTFIFGGLTVQHQAMLQRHMRFFAVGVIEIVSMAVAVVVAIAAALLGAGYWSLVFMHITLALTTTIGKWIVFPWFPGKPKRGVGVRQMLSFGGNITASSIVNYISRHLDHVLIGRLSGSVALGLYSKAFSLLLLPLSQIRNPIGSVAIPALSRLQNDPTGYLRYYSQVIYYMSFFSMPLTAFLIVMSRQVIEVVLGPQWLEASGIFAILGIFGMVYAVWGSNGWLFVTTNQTNRMLRWGLVDGAMLTIAIAVSASYGPIAVAVSVTACRLILFIPTMWYASRGTPVTLTVILNEMKVPFLSSILMAALVYSFRVTVLDKTESWQQLLLALPLALAVYLITACILERSFQPLQRLHRIKQVLIQKKTF